MRLANIVILSILRCMPDSTALQLEHGHHKEPVIRDSIVSGLFYPETGPLLKDKVEALLALYPYKGFAQAIVSPHGSYEYSGGIAALAWSAVAARQCIEHIVIIGPWHRAVQKGIFLSESSAFSTPLGQVEVDTDMIENLVGCNFGLHIDDIPHLGEHSIEIHLPFMKSLFPQARLTPVLIGLPDQATVLSLAHALSDVFKNRLKSTIFVISTNIAAHANLDIAWERAQNTFSMTLSNDWQGILNTMQEQSLSCGEACLASYLAAGISKPDQATILGTSNSLIVSELEEGHIVQYAALAFSSS